VSASEPEPEAAAGSVEPRLGAEFPGLELRWVALQTRGGPSPTPLRERLRALSDRGRGARVLAVRTQPIAHAYRAFFRQTGLDPDVTRIPSEEVAVRRLLQGGFRSDGRLRDALLIALVETGVPVWALRHEATDPQTLIIRTSRAGESVGDSAAPLEAGSLVLADAHGVHGALFGPLASGHSAGVRSRQLVLVCVGVDGVPRIFLEEALWLCAEILSDP
jgi:DNA/RNA-binding domain of Phe-tRNA-synthetase-like protein